MFLIIVVSGCNNMPDEIVACGGDQVVIIDGRSEGNGDADILWRWKVSEATDLPLPFHKYMIPTDECKPVNGNKEILITSSGGGVVLVDRETKKTLFYAHVPMAHSAEILPGNKIIVALSTDPGGNSIELFDLSQNDKVLFCDSLYSGHGVVWMSESEILFALGYNELRKYALRNWDSEIPELELITTFRLPENGGHDLNKISADELILTTTNSVWTFNIPEERFIEFELLAGVPNVKSINYDNRTKRLIYTMGELSWWTHNIYQKNPDRTISIPDINLYKVRIFAKD